MILIARNIDVESFGKFTFAISFVSLFLILADLGLSSFSIIEIARNRIEKKWMLDYIHSVFPLKLILSILTFLFISLLINLIQYPQDTKIIVYFMGLIYILTPFTEFIASLFRGIEKIECEGIIMVVKNLFLFLIVVTALFLTHNVIFISGAWTISIFSRINGLFCLSK